VEFQAGVANRRRENRDLPLAQYFNSYITCAVCLHRGAESKVQYILIESFDFYLDVYGLHV
jgi:hypothetical protein